MVIGSDPVADWSGFWWTRRSSSAASSLRPADKHSRLSFAQFPQRIIKMAVCLQPLVRPVPRGKKMDLIPDRPTA